MIYIAAILGVFLATAAIRFMWAVLANDKKELRLLEEHILYVKGCTVKVDKLVEIFEQQENFKNN